MAINDITGDRIASKISATYADNFDSIFRRKKGHHAAALSDSLESSVYRVTDNANSGNDRKENEDN